MRRQPASGQLSKQPRSRAGTGATVNTGPLWDTHDSHNSPQSSRSATNAFQPHHSFLKIRTTHTTGPCGVHPNGPRHRQRRTQCYQIKMLYLNLLLANSRQHKRSDQAATICSFKADTAPTEKYHGRRNQRTSFDDTS